MSRRDGTPVLVNGTASTLQRVELAGGQPAVLNEEWLQKLLFDHPECLPIGDIEPAFKNLVSVCRELPTLHGPIDNLFMTAEGQIVIAETKLWRNSQARREAVAQALDYASCLFGMGYDAFEAAALKGSFGGRPKPAGLYEMLAERKPSGGQDWLTEPEFIDAVSLNLSRGRIVILVVGDGMRTETERFADALQSHAGFHFTFALVELAVCHVPQQGGLLVMPRTLARTQMIDRGIVRVVDGKIVVEPTPPEQAGTSNISAEEFYDAMAVLDPDLPAKLKAFIRLLESKEVVPEFQRTLILRWKPPSGDKPINLGYITQTGSIWTDLANCLVPHALSHVYIENLARAWGGEVERKKYKENWCVLINGKAPKVQKVADKLDAWHDVIVGFVDALQAHYAEAPEPAATASASEAV
jgi:hypothetical protein